MKKQFIILGVVICAPFFFLFSCNSPQSKRGEIDMSNTDTAITPLTKDTATAVKEDWQSFKADANQKIEATNDSLELLMKKINRTDKKASAKIETDIARLQQRNRELKGKLENYNDRGAEKWQKFKHDFTIEMDSISANWKNLRKSDY